MKRPHRRSCSCGWAGSYPTASYAARGLARHSCDTDWSPRPCPHPTKHRHGTPAAYTHCGCRCEPCRDAIRGQENTTRRARAYGRQRLVDATRAGEHVEQLMAAGLGHPRIAELAGLDRSLIIRLVWGKTRAGRREHTKRITRDTEARLLAVTYDPADGGPPVDGGATARRLRALVALGWYPSLLARELDMDQAYVDRLLRGRSKASGLVRPGTARRVHDAYLRLANQPPPTGTYADRARRTARARGWLPPLRVGGRVVAGAPIELEEAS